MNFLRNSLNEMMIQVRSRQFGLLYDYKQYHRIVKMMKTPKQYDQILINQYPVVYFLLSEENEELLELLLNNNSNLKQHILCKVDQKLQVNAMNFAVLNNLEKMVELLQKHGQLITDTQIDTKHTILHLGARFGRVQVLQKGLLQGVDIDQQDVEGMTSLHIATQYQHLEAVEYLLDKGAATYLHTNDQLLPIHLAVVAQHLQLVQLLSTNLLQLRNQKQIGPLDPVHIAAQMDSLSILEQVSEQGGYLLCNRSGEQKGGGTAIHFAVNGQQIDNVKYILSHQPAQVDCQDVNLNTPLHLAVLLNNYSLVQTILQFNPQPQLCNRDQLTPIDLASFIPDQQIINIFKKHSPFTHMFTTRHF